MQIKNYLAAAALAASIGVPSVALAHEAPTPDGHRPHHCHKMMPFVQGISKEQRVELRDFLKASHEKMLPLIREKQALNLQLAGLLATPGTQWDDISKVVDKINDNRAKMTREFARNQFEVVKKFGVVLPPPPPHHHFR